MGRGSNTSAPSAYYRLINYMTALLVSTLQPLCTMYETDFKNQSHRTLELSDELYVESLEATSQ
jgi:hypothetical protein